MKSKSFVDESLREFFSYDPETGIVTRKKDVFSGNRHSRCVGRIGDVVGCRDKNGYLRAWWRGKPLFIHRLGWFLHHGSWPQRGVDHINGDGADNRLMNLRDVSKSVNGRNRYTKHGKDKQLPIGIALSPRGYYRVTCKVHGQFRNTLVTTLPKAIVALERLRKEMGYYTKQ